MSPAAKNFILYETGSGKYINLDTVNTVIFHSSSERATIFNEDKFDNLIAEDEYIRYLNKKKVIKKEYV